MRQTLTEDDKKERRNDGRESKNKETKKVKTKHERGV